MHELYSVGLAECFKLPLRHVRCWEGFPSFKAARYQDDSLPSLEETLPLVLSLSSTSESVHRIFRPKFLNLAFEE